MKIIILDRDGVINYDSDDYIKNADEFEIIPNSLEAIANFVQLDYKVVVCTNQSGIGRGLYSTADLNEIHEKMCKLVGQSGGEITAIFICPHTPQDKCECRKPKPKMLLEICERFNVEDISQVMFVGDSLRDLQAIDAVGGIPVLVKTGNGRQTLIDGNLPPGTIIFEDLHALSEHLLEEEIRDGE